MDIKEQNALLSKFMGYYQTEDAFYYNHDLEKGYEIDSKIYKESWDWLMPVWFKFRDLKFMDEDMANRIEHANYCQSIAQCICYCTNDDYIKALDVLVSAIKWYNSLNK